MLFGLGEAWVSSCSISRSLPLPFVGGRSRPFALTTALCRNLGLNCTARRDFLEGQRVEDAVESALTRRPARWACSSTASISYFSQPIHFAGHFVAAYGFDDADVLLVDTEPQGTLQRAPRAAVEAARFARGPMAAKARSWTIAAPTRASASSPPRFGRPSAPMRAPTSRPHSSGASHLGISKLAESLPSWPSLRSIRATDLALAALLMERAGTGGALFRNFYRDFLREAREHLPRARPRWSAAQACLPIGDGMEQRGQPRSNRAAHESSALRDAAAAVPPDRRPRSRGHAYAGEI